MSTNRQPGDVPGLFDHDNLIGFNPKGFYEPKNLLAGTNWFQHVQFFFLFFYWIAGWFAMSTVVFLRKDFGERYLSWFNLYAGYTVVWFMAFPVTLVDALAYEGEFSGTMQVFYGLFILVSLYHRYVIYRRNRPRRFSEWHSLNSAIPLLAIWLNWALGHFGRWLEPRMQQGLPHRPITLNLWVSDDVTKRYIEPLFLVAVGWFFFEEDTGMRLWLFISAAAVFYREQLDYFLARQKVLDMMDSRIEGKYLAPVLRGESATSTAGFTMPISSVRILKKALAGVQLAPPLSRTNGQGARPDQVPAPAPDQTPDAAAIHPATAPISGGLSDAELAMLDDDEEED